MSDRLSMTRPRRKDSHGVRYCAAKVACDGAPIYSRVFDACERCRRKQAQRAATAPTPLRGERCLEQQRENDARPRRRA